MDIENMTVDDYDALSEQNRMVMELKLNKTTVTSEPELTKQIIDYIHFYCIAGQPTLMGSLTRRFSRPAVKQGIDIGDIITTLAQQDKIRIFKRNGKQLLVSEKWYAMAKAAHQTSANLEYFLSKSPA